MYILDCAIHNTPLYISHLFSPILIGLQRGELHVHFRLCYEYTPHLFLQWTFLKSLLLEIQDVSVHVHFRLCLWNDHHMSLSFLQSLLYL